MLYLDPWNKVMVMAGAAAAVAITILMVVCFVGEGCLVYEVITNSKKKKDQARRLSGALYGAADKNGANLTNYAACGRRDVRHIPTRQQSVASAHSLNERVERSLLSRLSSRSRTDSTYSSMSSGRTSPSSSCPPEDNHNRDKLPSSPPAVAFSLLASISPDSSVAKLAIAVESATDLPTRDYGAHCDPWVSVTVLRDRRSIRRRPPAPIAFFRTKTIRHAHNPFYSQTFITDIPKNEMKDISLLLTVMDQDRHCGAVEMGHTTITLKDAKQTVEDPVKFSTAQFIKQTKKECGDILFGLSYLPTAQRLSFSLIKMTNIKMQNIKEGETINPYLRIMMFSQSGRLIKKKKTTVKVGTKDPVFNETLNFEVAPGQLEVSRFLVTLCNRRQVVDTMIMEDGMEGTNPDSSDQEAIGPGSSFESFSERYGRRESQGKQKDACIGRIALGAGVYGEKEKDHYRSVCETPRQVFSMWHTVR
eukprot:TRINITY_DN19311_c0_g1_i1.p1 TRINITY_DN19311_c0_g1~~TRINITY_DN19311_c0_g1_i1.p1  ORF type:complete len:476 (+),score=146.04 TRINITY_DN19311_c0_g1_i1:93-1520(+)